MGDVCVCVVRGGWVCIRVAVGWVRVFKFLEQN